MSILHKTLRSSWSPLCDQPVLGFLVFSPRSWNFRILLEIYFFKPRNQNFLLVFLSKTTNNLDFFARKTKLIVRRHIVMSVMVYSIQSLFETTDEALQTITICNYFVKCNDSIIFHSILIIVQVTEQKQYPQINFSQSQTPSQSSCRFVLFITCSYCKPQVVIAIMLPSVS